MTQFEGMTCEIFFNTFDSFKPTMYTLMNITPFMLLYPLSNFFKLKPKHFSKNSGLICFVLPFLLWFNFFFDPYNSEFELFFGMQVVLLGLFGECGVIGVILIVVYFALAFVRKFNMLNYVGFSFYESTSVNMLNYISYSCVSVFFMMAFIRLKRKKTLRKEKQKLKKD